MSEKFSKFNKDEEDFGSYNIFFITLKIGSHKEKKSILQIYNPIRVLKSIL